MTPKPNKRFYLEDVRPKAQDGLDAMANFAYVVTPRTEVEYMMATGKTQEEAKRDLAYIQSLSGKYAVGTNPLTILANDGDVIADWIDKGTAYAGAVTGPAALTGNPYAIAANAGINVIGGIADAWQLGRSFYKGDMTGALFNGAELAMSIAGGRGVKSAQRDYNTARAAYNSATTPAQRTVRKKALDAAKKTLRREQIEAVGYDEAIAGSKLFDAEGYVRSLSGGKRKGNVKRVVPVNSQRFIAPADNTRVVLRPQLKYVQPRKK